MNSYLFGRKQYSPICNIEEGDNSSLRLKLNDGVSPMTYKKLKELGYTSDDWQNWSDDEKFEKSQAKSTNSQAESSKQNLHKESVASAGTAMSSEEANALLNHFDSANTADMSEQDKQKLLNTLSYKSVYSPEVGVIDFAGDGSDYEQAAAALMNAGKTKGTAKIFGKQANTQLVKMTPEEYIATCIDILGNTSEDDLNDEYVKARVDDLRRQMGRRKKLSPIYLDLRKDMLTQEGRHRMLALKQLGAKELPVLVITDPESSESLVRTNGALKYEGFQRSNDNKVKPVSTEIKGADLSEYA